MSNFSQKINLMKIGGSLMCDLQFGDKIEKCYVVKLDESGMFYNDKSVYLEATAWENKQPGQYGDTHGIKQKVKKETFQAMTDEQRKAMPYIGNMRPLQQQDNAQQPTQPDNNLPY